MHPLVYLYEEQLRDIFKEKVVSVRDINGAAFVWDEGTVFHAYTRPYKVRPAGLQCKCLFRLLESDDSLAACEPQAKGILGLADGSGDGDLSSMGLVILLALDSSGRLRHRAFTRLAGELVECTVRFVPGKSELYSRSKGLLEIGVLERNSVAVVGLGSGGSPIAVELAKAGVGNFILIDFDRLELSNIARHVCGINDLGRFKTYAVRDIVWQKNPFANVKTLQININESLEECREAISGSDLIICASDSERSRFNINQISLQFNIPAIYGRAITRAAGGDVLRVLPYNGPCYNCLFSQKIIQSDEQEFSQPRQVREAVPDYTSDDQTAGIIQVGLSSDIAPISNMMVKLALVELSRGLPSGISSLEQDLVSNFFVWANRRERAYSHFSPMGYSFNKPSILRWYGARVERDDNCTVCSTRETSDSNDFFG